ncbi:MAG: hypothetical protein LBB34_02485, partial [Holosporales bacterium]|nr:hypothetical protein [Holosporales bacterium]
YQLLETLNIQPYTEKTKIENEIHDFLKEYGPIDSNESRKWWDEQINIGRTEHCKSGSCNEMKDCFEDEQNHGITSIIHIPNIRTYAILNKKEYGGFDPINYCPFCGAKLSERLDEKLTEILRSEYGLDSWKDYKKAPQEFQTDEWWKKRGL